MKKVFLALVLVIVMLFVYSNYTVGVTDYEIKIENLPDSFDGFKILQLSDLHNKDFANLIDKINDAKPDIVVMTGDMVSTSDEDYDVFLNYADKIADKYPTYFIVGNHEQALSRADYAELMTQISNTGVYILDNSCVTLEKGEKTVNLYGMWFNLRFYRDINDANTDEYIVDAEHMNRILEKSKGGVNILLTHNPVYFDAYAEWGADLTLAGHMHGGMVQIPFKGGLFSPEKEYFPEYDAGLFKNGDSTLVVSRGLGEHKGFRFLNQPEIVVVTLKK